ncbi:hypothetical protein ACFE04_014963 [Oxalis oulophora]
MDSLSQNINLSHFGGSNGVNFADLNKMSINDPTELNQEQRLENRPDLELGLGLSSYQSPKYGFTDIQREELQTQLLIHKHLEARVPVPHQLITPIWNHVANSQHGLNVPGFQCQPHNHNSTVMSNKPDMQQEYGDVHDYDKYPEPGRCRKTDGRHWRCPYEAIDGHNYCATHVRAGKQSRSKKASTKGQSATDGASGSGS